MFLVKLGSIKINMQIDIGFGDAVYPDPMKSDFPSALDHPAPCLWCYSRESTMTEKLEAMIKLSMLNSRMKDFYDIWMLSRQFDFQAEVLTKAVDKTLRNRGTMLPNEINAFSKEFVKGKHRLS